MALFALLILAAAATLSALGDWRAGLIWMLVIAAVQDPLRKLIPGSSGSLLLLVIPVFLAMLVGMFSVRSNVWRRFQSSFPDVGQSLGWFVMACLPAAMLSFTYGPGSWVYTAFGVLSYGIILSSILIGFYYLRSEQDLRRLLSIYCLIAAAALSGTFLEYFKIDAFGSLVGTKALNFDWIRYGSGFTLKLLAGFYRSPDVMGWHAAAAAMFSMVLVFAGTNPQRWRWLGVTGIAIAALAVSGRRKMVYMLPFFLIMVVVIYQQSRRRSLDLQSLVLLCLPLVIAFVVGDWLGPDSDFLRYYTGNPDDVAVQAQRHGWDSVIETLRQSGFWGSGLGFATPGSQNIPFPKPKVWQESGLSRLMVELGIPGLVMMVVLLGRLLMAGLRGVRWQFESGSPFSRYSVALLAFVLANVASLAISGQILADPFIASFIGIVMGMQLSLTRLALLPTTRLSPSSKLHLAPSSLPVQPLVE